MSESQLAIPGTPSRAPTHRGAARTGAPTHRGAAAFGHDGPPLVDVRTARHELALPPKLTVGQIKGLTLYATRTILSGCGEELVELAKTNLRQLAAE